MMQITQVKAQEILDSRGTPTLRATVILKGGAVGVASVPSGASTGIHEALELRDLGKRYNGKGVLKAKKNIETTIAKGIKGMDASKQRKIDQKMLELDGTENKKNLGANSILAVSLATARAAALAKKRPLYKHIRKTFSLKENKWKMPTPTMNVINGGEHADNGLSIQEFMLVPKHKKFSERVRIGVEIFHELKGMLKKKGYMTNVGDEGGFAPNLKKNEQALIFLVKAIEKAGYIPGKHVFLAMDLAASEFYKNGKYYLDNKSGVSAVQVTATLRRWLTRYPIVSIEDPLAEDDWENWASFTKKLGKNVAIVGDDLFVTNVNRLEKGISSGVGNAILIKLNQIGSLSETIDAILLAKKNKYQVSVSHRSGETADTFIADLAVAVNAEYIKTGSLSRSERVEKYNRLMAIEQDLKL